jgi:hypothetical protein
MAKTNHEDFADLIHSLAKQGKFLSVQVHDARPDEFGDGDVLPGVAEAMAACCHKLGYDPDTGETICLDPC